MLDQYNTRDFYTLCMSPNNFKTATLRSRQAGNAQASFTDYALPRARRKTLTKDAPIGGLGKTSKQVDIFQIWQDSLDSATQNGNPTVAPPPKASDEIVDSDGLTWIINSIAHTLCDSDGTGNVWDCTVVASVNA